MRRPVLSNSTRGLARVLAPVSPPSLRVSHSAPADSRGSRTPTNTPARVRGIESPTDPTWPTPPLANALPTAPTYVQPVSAKVLRTLLSALVSGVNVNLAA